MAFPVIKKRRLSSSSGPDHIITYPHPATNEAKANDTTSWDSAVGDSNMFQLKIHQLLAQVQPDYERRMVKAENALRMLKGTIERIPDREAKPVCILPLSLLSLSNS